MFAYCLSYNCLKNKVTDANYLVKCLSTAEMAVSEVPDACVPSTNVESQELQAASVTTARGGGATIVAQAQWIPQSS